MNFKIKIIKPYLYVLSASCLLIAGSYPAFSGPRKGCRLELLKFIPGNVSSLFFLDPAKAPSSDDTMYLTGEEGHLSGYFEFLDNAGIDPGEDIFCAAIFGSGKRDNDSPAAAAVINIRYERQKFLSGLRTAAEKENAGFGSGNISGSLAYSVLAEESQEPVWFFFIDSENIAAGNLEGVKAVIRASRGEVASLSAESGIVSIIPAESDTDFFQGGALFGSEGVESEILKGHPMFQGLEGITAVTVTAGYSEKDINIIIRGHRQDEVKNRQMAEMLTGLRSLILLSGENNNQFPELLEKINIDSDSESITVSAVFPEKLFESDR